MTPPELTVVIPVHDEGTTIAESIRAWRATLARCGIAAAFIVIDDGSTDATPDILVEFAGRNARIRPIRQEALGLVAPHNPLPLLAQLAERSPIEVEYLVEGPQVWELRIVRQATGG